MLFVSLILYLLTFTLYVLCIIYTIHCQLKFSNNPSYSLCTSSSWNNNPLVESAEELLKIKPLKNHKIYIPITNSNHWRIPTPLKNIINRLIPIKKIHQLNYSSHLRNQQPSNIFIHFCCVWMLSLSRLLSPT